MTRLIVATIAAALCAAPASAAADPLAPFDGQTVTVSGHGVKPASPDVFGTVALNAGVTAYGARWRRVSKADLSDPRLLTLASPARALDPVARLNWVQSEVNGRIAWKRDLDGWHIADYWAEAGETLTRGYGDAEDIAILKMQLLKAAGIPSRDIYISVGRDKERGVDTRLLVRAGDGFYVLDDRSPQPVASRDYAGFDPIITLGVDSAWLHGRRVGSPGLHRTAAYRTSAVGRHGFAR